MSGYSELRADAYGMEAPELGRYVSVGRSPTIGVTAWSLLALMALTGAFGETYGKSWIPQVASLCVVVSWLVVDVATGKKRARFQSYYILFFIYIVLTFVSSLINEPDVPLMIIVNASLSLVKVYAIGWVVANIVRNYRQFVPLWIGCVIAPLTLLYTSRAQLGRVAVDIERGVESDALRISGEDVGGFGDANGMSRIGVYALIGCAGLFFLWKGKSYRYLALLPIPAVLYYISLLGSRTGMAATAFAVFAIWFFHLRKVGSHGVSQRLAVFIVGIVLMLGVIYWVATSPFAYRFKDVGHEYGEGRGQLALIGLRMFIHSPIIGHGMFGFRRMAAEYGAGQNVAHCLPVDILVRCGVPGFIAFYGAWFILLKKLLFLRKQSVSTQDLIVLNMALISLFIWHGFSLTLSQFMARASSLLMGAIVGYVYTLEEQLAEETYAVREPTVNEGEQPASVSWS